MTTIPLYSAVGVFKYTTKPTVVIDNLVLNTVNTIVPVEFIGRMTYDENEVQDATERIEYYKFDIYYNGNLNETSGWQLRSANEQSIDSYKPVKIKNDNYYLIAYTIKTQNGLIVSSPLYPIVSNEFAFTLNVLTEHNLTAYNQFDNGYIDIMLNNTQDINQFHLQGVYEILRRRAGEDIWTHLIELTFDTLIPQCYIIYKDYAIEQGVRYEYGFRQIGASGIVSNLLISPPVLADFEDMFLFDGVKQLKIRFNPQMSSFKKTLQEQKIDTLGSKYPSFVRNGRLGYKEFPLSGLLSYLLDENADFISVDHSSITSYTNLTSDNIYYVVGQYKNSSNQLKGFLKTIPFTFCLRGSVGERAGFGTLQRDYKRAQLGKVPWPWICRGWCKQGGEVDC